MAKVGSSKRYAQAAFQLAIEHNKVETWGQTLSDVAEILTNSDLVALLEHAKVPLSKKIEILGAVLKDSDQILRNFVSLLISKGLIEIFEDICCQYHILLNKHLGREPVEVTSAIALTPAEEKHISGVLNSLTKKEVLLNITIDASILGGLVIRVGDRLIDGSTRTMLDGLRRSMTSGTGNYQPSEQTGR